MNSVPLLVNLFLSIEGQMVAVFSHHDLRQQARRGQAAIQQSFRQGGDHRRRVQFGSMHKLSAHDSAPEKTPRLIIQLLADFLADATPGFRLGLDRFGIDHFFHHRQVFWQTRLSWRT